MLLRGKASAAALLAIVLASACLGCGRAPSRASFTLESAPPEIPADGFSLAIVALRAGRTIPPDGITARVLGPARSAAISSILVEGAKAEVRVRAGVLPGDARIEIRTGGFEPYVHTLRLLPDYTDRDRDGTPDYLVLDDEADRRAFLGWFTFLAEAQYIQRADRRPREIADCSALLRFAYREALREHGSEWANELRLPSAPPLPSVRKYQYPYTPIGASLFRVQPGPYQPSDIDSGAFAQFADAETLMRRNSWFVSRILDHAQPGDLLFFRQVEQRLPFHAMIYLGPSHFEPPHAGERYVVYHTGPSGADPGEMRHLTVGELLAHPLPQWRPLPGNGNFLGVYRWNILKDAT